MRTANDVIFTAQSLGATVASAPILVENLYLMDIMASWTGASADGTLKIQVSDDFPVTGNYNDVVNWSDPITGGSINPATAVTVSGPGSQRWELGVANGFGYRWVRMLFTRTSGTGLIDARFNAKGF